MGVVTSGKWLAVIGYCIHVIMPSSTIILWSEVSDGSSIPDCLATSLCSVHEQLGDRKSSFTFKPRLLSFWYLHLSDCSVLYMYSVYTQVQQETLKLLNPMHVVMMR